MRDGGKYYGEKQKQGWRTGRFGGEGSQRRLTDKKTFEQRSEGGKREPCRYLREEPSKWREKQEEFKEEQASLCNWDRSEEGEGGRRRLG